MILVDRRHLTAIKVTVKKSSKSSATPVGGHLIGPSIARWKGLFHWREKMGKKTVVMIDGGHLRALTKLVHKTYDPNLIEKYALACPTADEELVRILYYDCAPYNGTQSQPISKTRKKFEASDAWLKVLAERPLFAVRVGQLKFRGFALDSVPIHPNPLSDANFRPVFDQKGVETSD